MPFDPNLTSFFKLDEATNSATYVDQLGNNNLARKTGTNDTVTKVVGANQTNVTGSGAQFRRFSNDTGYLFLADASVVGLDITTESFSFGAWARLEGSLTGTQPFLSKYNKNTNNRQYLLFSTATRDPTFIWGSSDGSLDRTLTGPRKLQLNKWAHVVAVYDRTINEARLYVSGVLQNSTTTNVANLANKAADFRIASSLPLGTTPDRLNGSLDDAFFFTNKALSDSEVLDIYNNGVENFNNFTRSSGIIGTFLQGQIAPPNSGIIGTYLQGQIAPLSSGIIGTYIEGAQAPPSSSSGIIGTHLTGYITTFNLNSTNLTSVWRVDESSNSTTYIDQKGNNNLTKTEGTTTKIVGANQTSNTGSGTKLNNNVGTSPAVLTRTDASAVGLDITTQSFTTGGWVKVTTDPGAGTDIYFINKYDTGFGEQQYYVKLTSAAGSRFRTTFTWGFGGASEASIQTPGSPTFKNHIPLNTWAHIIATYDRAIGEARLYINGIRAAESTNDINDLNDSPASFLIGATNVGGSTANHFGRDIDDVFFFSGRALDDIEALVLYWFGIGGLNPSSGIIGTYLQGTTAPLSSGIIGTYIQGSGLGFLPLNLEFDAHYSVQAFSSTEFDAEIIVAKDSFAEFDAEITVERNSIPTNVVIYDPDPSGISTNGPDSPFFLHASGIPLQGKRNATGRWTFGDFSKSSGVTNLELGSGLFSTFHVYQTSGNFFPKFELIDNEGTRSCDTTQIIITNGQNPTQFLNEIPQVVLTASASSGNNELEVTFNRTITNLGTRSVLYEEIDFSDGANTSLNTNGVTHLYNNPGIFTPIISVRLSDNLIICDTLEIGAGE